MQTIPFYIYYSMFGFQRVGDFAWAGGDSRSRGFLIGGTAGRTTLAGEGLQHQDGHSQLVATTIPNCRAYDPCYAYELAVIIQDGLRRMVAEQEDIFYYISVMNENYAHPALPEGAADGILRGMYPLRTGGKGKLRVQLLGSGTILREVLAAADLLQEKFGIPADVWSVTSFSELRRDALDVRRWNSLHPESERRSELRREDARGPAGAVHRGDRLHEDRVGPDPRVGAGPLRGARHRRLRPQRRPRRAALALRGRSQVDRASRRSARSRTTAASTARPSETRSRSSASIPRSRNPVTL